MRFAVKGTTFEYDGRFLARMADNGAIVASQVDLTLYLYDRPSCADAVKVAVAMLANPNLEGR